MSQDRLGNVWVNCTLVRSRVGWEASADIVARDDLGTVFLVAFTKKRGHYAFKNRQYIPELVVRLDLVAVPSLMGGLYCVER
jgi:hypothetical protein